MIAIINNVSYSIISQSPEPNGVLHLIINEDIPIDSLRQNILASEEIVILEDNDQVIANYIGYNKIRQVNVNLYEEENPQIDVVIEFNNISNSIDSIQKKLTSNEEGITNCNNRMSIIESDIEFLTTRIRTAESTVENLNYEYQTFSQNIAADVDTLREAINNLTIQINNPQQLAVQSMEISEEM